MAVQIPDPGTGNGQTGDNEYVFRKKVKDNFSDQTNAANKLVGKQPDNVVQVKDCGNIAFENKISLASSPITRLSEAPANSSVFIGRSDLPDHPTGINLAANLIFFKNTATGNGGLQIIHGIVGNNPTKLLFRTDLTSNTWHNIYHSGNTTKDVGTGFLKTSSPVLHVYNDKIDKIHEAEQLDIIVDKKGVGHYEIHGTTGLRQNDGWNMSPPRDIHGNVRCMIEVTEKDDVITVKTYKRKFDLELAAIVHDYDNPLDIPDGACVELRFNDLPYDNLDDTQTEI